MHIGGVKLVFAGPVGAGKSTAIRAIADTEPVSTEMPLVDGAIGDKTTTTVALDFATVILDEGAPLFVYGLPGQQHFEFIYSIVIEGALGVVVLLNGRDLDVSNQCERWLHTIRGINKSIPIVIGVTQTDSNPDFTLKPIREVLRRYQSPAPAFTVDARSRDEIAQLVRALLLAM